MAQATATSARRTGAVVSSKRHSTVLNRATRATWAVGSTVMTTDEIDRLVEALRANPQRKRVVLSALLAEDFLALPERVTEMDARLTARLGALASHVAEMDARLTARLDTLAARLDDLTSRVSELVGIVHRHDDQLGDLRGWRVEDRCRTHGDALLAALGRRLRLMGSVELMEMVEDAEDAGVLSHEETTDVRLADAVFRGRAPDGEAVYLVVEASAGIGLRDVARARRRADTLARTGVRTLPVVGGERIDPDSAVLAGATGVEVVIDGTQAEAS